MQAFQTYIQQKIAQSFYEENEVLVIARQLTGKVLVTNFNGQLTAARIVETEAYNGVVDKACHAYNNRRTKRTEIMFGNGGHAYVYLCYGIHYLFNIVCSKPGNPQAVLIRAVEPLHGIELMMQRKGSVSHGFELTRGPGNVTKALGIAAIHNGLSVQSNEIFIADDGIEFSEDEILITKRIGVDYAAEDALLPYRFIVKGNKYVSGKKLMNL